LFSFHWIVLIIGMESRTINVLDSMRKDPSDYDEVVNVLNEYFMSFHLNYLIYSWYFLISTLSFLFMCSAWSELRKRQPGLKEELTLRLNFSE